MGMKYTFFSDFDGTITREDVMDKPGRILPFSFN
jgi:2-hydroxy-3-keto-5-methylthiopentenyl-1-phosphate phosphatase